VGAWSRSGGAEGRRTLVRILVDALFGGVPSVFFDILKLRRDWRREAQGTKLWAADGHALGARPDSEAKTDGWICGWLDGGVRRVRVRWWLAQPQSDCSAVKRGRIRRRHGYGATGRRVKVSQTESNQFRTEVRIQEPE
jgi:hypothetical protein